MLSGRVRRRRRVPFETIAPNDPAERSTLNAVNSPGTGRAPGSFATLQCRRHALAERRTEKNESPESARSAFFSTNAPVSL